MINAAAEQALIASVLMDPDVALRSQVRVEHLTIPAAKTVWAEAQRLATTGFALTPADLWSILDPDDAQAVLSYGELAGYTTAAGISHYDELVLDAYHRREAQQLGARLMTMAKEPGETVEKMRAMASVFSEGDGVVLDRDTVSTRDMFDRVQAIIQKFEDRRNSGKQLMWPWRSWNMVIGQMMPGMLYLLGAAESTGKTVAAENIADNLAMHGFKVAFFHLELSHTTMTLRQIARYSGVPARSIEEGDMTEEEARRVADAAEEIESWPGEVFDIHSPQWTSAQIVRKVNAIKPDVVIIDYMQKVHSTGVGNQSSPDLLRWYPGMLEDIKGMAEVNDIPVILLTQLAQEFKNKKPEAGAARWMKEAEEKANGVIYMWREVTTSVQKNKDGQILAEPGTRSMKTGVVVTKNTMGRQGDLGMLTLDGPSFRFVEK